MPLATDPILQSFSQLRANFQAIDNGFATNHVGLTQNQDTSGMHSVLTFRPVADPVTSATQIAIYSKLVATVPELFFAPKSAQTPIQLTYPSIQTGLQSTNPDVYFDRQYSFVAGPFIIYGGIVRGAHNGDVITLTPGTTLLYVDLTAANVVKASAIHAPMYACPTNIAGTNFTIALNPGLSSARDIYYFAIGI